MVALLKYTCFLFLSDRLGKMYNCQLDLPSEYHNCDELSLKVYFFKFYIIFLALAVNCCSQLVVW